MQHGIVLCCLGAAAWLVVLFAGHDHSAAADAAVVQQLESMAALNSKVDEQVFL